jgi:hypothetical protein
VICEVLKVLYSNSLDKLKISQKNTWLPKYKNYAIWAAFELVVVLLQHISEGFGIEYRRSHSSNNGERFNVPYVPSGESAVRAGTPDVQQESRRK